MVKVFVKGNNKKYDLYNFILKTLILVIVLGISAGLGLIINNGYDKNSYDHGFYDGLKSFCGNLSVGLKDGDYVCYDKHVINNRDVIKLSGVVLS